MHASVSNDVCFICIYAVCVDVVFHCKKALGLRVGTG